ncbi:hypothetical protein JCM10213_007703 [Rhodosporidiobolus nylandii]
MNGALPSPRPLSGVTEGFGTQMMMLSWLIVLPPLTLTLFALPSSALTLVFLRSLTRNQPSSVRLEGASWLAYTAQAWLAGWMLLDAAWSRDERGEVLAVREARRLSLDHYTRSSYAQHAARHALNTAFRTAADDSALGRTTPERAWNRSRIEPLAEAFDRAGAALEKASARFPVVLASIIFFLFLWRAFEPQHGRRPSASSKHPLLSTAQDEGEKGSADEQTEAVRARKKSAAGLLALNALYSLSTILFLLALLRTRGSDPSHAQRLDLAWVATLTTGTAVGGLVWS